MSSPGMPGGPPGQPPIPPGNGPGGPPPPPPPPPPQPPAGGPGMPMGGGYAQKPDNYLVWSILATLFCCLPLGIVAIVKATKVDGLWNTGNYDAAVAASEDAKKWTLITAIVGVVGVVLYFLFVVVLGAFSSTSSML